MNAAHKAKKFKKSQLMFTQQDSNIGLLPKRRDLTAKETRAISKLESRLRRIQYKMRRYDYIDGLTMQRCCIRSNELRDEIARIQHLVFQQCKHS